MKFAFKTLASETERLHRVLVRSVLFQAVDEFGMSATALGLRAVQRVGLSPEVGAESQNDLGVALFHFQYNNCRGCYPVHSSIENLLDYFKMAGVFSR